MTLQERKSDRNYYSFLLRLWKVDMADNSVWRASLEPVGTKERHGFARLEHLYTFLDEHCQAPSAFSAGEPPANSTIPERGQF